MPAETGRGVAAPETVADSAAAETVPEGPPPAPWELARLAEEAAGQGSVTVGADETDRIEAVIPESPVRAEAPDPSQPDALSDAIAHAADSQASPSEAQARWRIVDRLLRWLPEAEEDDDAPLR
jgi:hypothetical protein